VAQGFVRQARKADGAAGKIFKAFIGVGGRFRAAESGKPQLEPFFVRHPVNNSGRYAQQRKFRVASGGNFQGIEVVLAAVFLKRGKRAAFLQRHGLGKKLDQRIQIRLAGDVHSGLLGIFQQVLLQGGVDNMRVIAIAQQCFAYGYGVFERLMHPWLLAKKITGNGSYYACEHALASSARRQKRPCCRSGLLFGGGHLSAWPACAQEGPP